jgi:glutamate-1-semialdehyde 2,1-aminomutase
VPKIGKGQRLWDKAKTIIPGGNMLLSKRPEMFLPDQWPAYYSRAEGARIWDMDGNEYVDMSIMGIGANLLGYAHPKVDEAVRNSIGNGNLATLNAPEEVAHGPMCTHRWRGKRHRYPNCPCCQRSR